MTNRHNETDDPHEALFDFRRRVAVSGSTLETQALFDELVERNLDAIIDEIEVAASSDATFARVVAETALDEGYTPAHARLRQLQRDLAHGLGISRWEGFHSLQVDPPTGRDRRAQGRAEGD